MGIISDFLGKTAGDAIAKPIEAVGEAVGKFVTTDKDRMNYELEKQKLELNEKVERIGILKTLAASTNWMAANCIPMLILGTGFVYVFIYLFPLFIMSTVQVWEVFEKTGKIIPYPISGKPLHDLLVLLLGGGGIHIIDKLTKKK
ncbi:MAG: hypothetical protein E6R13_04425 [Spirochaetes bacterium]|nr:MAG: hypothetical protein E6R13_04425 [Spirochaetota bacterium]